MAQKENEFLNQRHLNHDVPRAQAYEIKQEASQAFFHRKPRTQQQWRQRQHDDGSRQADAHQIE